MFRCSRAQMVTCDRAKAVETSIMRICGGTSASRARSRAVASHMTARYAGHGGRKVAQLRSMDRSYCWPTFDAQAS